MWLGLGMGLQGAGLAIGAVVSFMTVPGIVVHGTDAANLERLLILPVIAGVGAAAITAGLTAARSAQARAEAREAELAAAMQVIERNRRSAHAIFEAVDVGLALLDRNGQPMLINQRLSEFSELAYPGGNITDGWVFDETGAVRLAIDDVPTSRARRGEEFDDVRVWVGEEEAARRAMSISARRVEHADGSLLGAAVSYTDVTDFMRALQVKDDFIALVSHELRTPLTSIVGYVAVILERTDLEPWLRKHLEVVARNGRRLQRLVGDLLEEVAALRAAGYRCASRARTSRPSSGTASSPPDRTRRAPGYTSRSTVPDTIALTGDPQRLAQVVDNLVSNAIKYTEPGGRAQVSASVDARSAVIRVRDTGIGISAGGPGPALHPVLPHREATLSAIQGVGLGLAITKSIVESHGGPDRGRQRAGPGQRVPRRPSAAGRPARLLRSTRARSRLLP